jgi:hypothetical protein
MEVLDLLKSGQLTGHKVLKISADLQEFPREILDLADSLELLELSGNRLSHLPDDFGQLKKLKAVFFNNNAFQAFPAVLAQCPQLSMISFKANRIKTIGPAALSPAIRWLTLTDNQLEALPAEIGKLSKLQKLMLAGNQLRALPTEMSACQNLELIRLSANQLQEIPRWLLLLPRLSWLAYAGNPYCDRTPPTPNTSKTTLPTIDPADLQFKEILGQGASGIIYKAVQAAQGAEPKTVAVKLFKGEITSDGLPQDEMRACIAAGKHPNLVNVLARLDSVNLDSVGPDSVGPDSVEPDNAEQAGLVFSFISTHYDNLGKPPSLESCTRDIYDADVSFELSVVLNIVKGIASAAAHLHATGLMHGDLYAHNILINEKGDSILGDFGAASFYDPADKEMGEALERLEVRAFGCLLEDLLNRCFVAKENSESLNTFNNLRQLQRDCMQPKPMQRPSFAQICKTLTQRP